MSKKRYVVIEFQKPVAFPRFPVAAGKRWGFQIGNEDMLARIKAIENGGEFSFAGGTCSAADVKVVYDGPGGREYLLTVGKISIPSSMMEKGAAA